MSVRVRPLAEEDRGWVREVVERLWGSPVVAAHGEILEPATLPGFVAEEGSARAGLLTYRPEGDACEVVTIVAFEPRRGIGSALMGALLSLDHRRVWLTTTNDNVPARRFYERLGFRLVAMREGEVARSRELKPEIPLVGVGGVPIRDELEYELVRPA
ncbi:MAG TPA: GNAT family N-acetyltransferase [Actinomycetota bacterium]|nr:GNAT family N-acetyltransferase [Actinomycetota bacterium]